MEYKKALTVGMERANAAAVALANATGLAAHPLCAVRSRPDSVRLGPQPDGWEPVGEEIYLDIAVFSHKDPAANALVLVVDGRGYEKACTKNFISKEEALRRVTGAAIPVSRMERSCLRRLLEERDLTEQVRASTLHIEM